MHRPELLPVTPNATGSGQHSEVRDYFYDLLAHYLSLYIRPGEKTVEINPENSELQTRLGNCQAVTDFAEDSPLPDDVNYVLLNGTIHRAPDIQDLFSALRKHIPEKTRLVIVYYSALWRPFIRLASKLGIRNGYREDNWVSHSDLDNLLDLADFERVRRDHKVLSPVRVPFLTNFLNRYLAPLPFFQSFCAVNIVIARPVPRTPSQDRPSVSVIVPTRNESGNIAEIIRRCPIMSPNDELIFVEGNSTDDTWAKIQEEVARYSGPLHLVTAQQTGRGKGDAVRKGFSLATRDILMILDADLTSPPEELPKFYEAIASKKGEYINGSRLVYPMEKEAMRFLNLLGNKAFALAFSFVLGQPFKDTLCGTKVLSRADYERLAAQRSFFGDFDPFGDFDLIFGAARLGLKIVEIPVHYRERTYGETNIQRWRHGVILLRMLLFACRKIKFT